MYKVKTGLSPPFMSEVFRYIGKGKETRAGDKFAAEKSKSLKWGDRSLRTFGPVVWNTMLPENLKASVSLDAFKVDIKSWTPDSNHGHPMTALANFAKFMLRVWATSLRKILR